MRILNKILDTLETADQIAFFAFVALALLVGSMYCIMRIVII